MPFRRRLLIDGEEVIAEVRPHWASLGWPLVAVLAAGVVAVGIAAAFPRLPVWAGDALLLLVLVAALWLTVRWTRRRATSLVLTTDRIVTRAGVLGRRGAEVRLDQIAAIAHRQSFGERILGTGSLIVERSGTGDVVVFDHVPKPAVVHRLVAEQVGAARPPWRDHGDEAPAAVVPAHRWAGTTPPAGVPAASGGSSSVTARLAELAELRRRGLVSADEYFSKRARLLDQL